MPPNEPLPQTAKVQTMTLLTRFSASRLAQPQAKFGLAGSRQGLTGAPATVVVVTGLIVVVVVVAATATKLPVIVTLPDE
jgi:hypothetical protein